MRLGIESLESKQSVTSKVNLPSIAEAELMMENVFLQQSLEELAETTHNTSIENIKHVQEVIKSGNLNNSLVQYLKLGGDFESFIGMQIPKITAENKDKISKTISQKIISKLAQVQGSVEVNWGTVGNVVTKVAVRAGIAGILSAAVAQVFSMYTFVSRTMKIITYVLNYATINSINEQLFTNVKIRRSSLKWAMKSTANIILDRIGMLGLIMLGGAGISKMIKGGAITKELANGELELISRRGIGAKQFAIAGSAFVAGSAMSSMVVLRGNNGILSAQSAAQWVSKLSDSIKVTDALINKTIDLDMIEAALTKFGFNKEDMKYVYTGAPILTEFGIRLGEAGWSVSSTFRFLQDIKSLESTMRQYGNQRKLHNSVSPNLTNIDPFTRNAVKTLLNVQHYTTMNICRTAAFLCMCLAYANNR